MSTSSTPPARGSAGSRLRSPLSIALIAAAVAALVIGTLVLRGGGTPRTPTPSPTRTLSFPTPIMPVGTPRAVYPQQLASADGRTVTLPSAPRRIVVLDPGAAESLAAIGAVSQIAAVADAPGYPENLAALPRLPVTASPDAIAARSPDLVLLDPDAAALARSLAARGLPALVLPPPATLETTLQQIQYFGNVTDHLAEAQQLVARLRARLDAVQRRLSGVTGGPLVYIETGPGPEAAGPVSLPGDLLRLLKARNVIDQPSAALVETASAQIVAANPDAIVVAATGAGESVAEVAARPGWEAIAAVRQGHVYAIAPELVLRPGPRLLDGLETLAHLLYPAIFA